jgi:ribonuclease D
MRESKGKIENLPKNWILKDEDIITMIKTRKIEILKKNKYFSNHEKERLTKLLKKIFKIKIEKHNNEIEIKCLEFFRYLVSKKYSIDANLIASKYDLTDYKNIKSKSKWRKKIYFDVFEKIIKGNKKFILNNFKPSNQKLH